jgi:integrase
MTQNEYLKNIDNANSKDFARKALIHFYNYLSINDSTEENYIAQLLQYNQDPKLYNELSNIKQHLVNNGLHPRTTRTYFNQIKLYLRSKNVRIYNEDVKTFVRFPKILKEEKIPLDRKIIQKLLDNSDNHMKFVILGLVSSGCRVSELLQLLFSDLKYPYVKIRPEIAKTGVARTTFFSSQVWSMINLLKSQADSDDYVFCSEYQPKVSLDELETKFGRTRQKAVLISRYQHSRYHHVTIHRFRAFCKTQASQVCDKDYAEGLIGHEGYQGTYNSLSDEEKLDNYKKLESRFIFTI